MASLVACTVAVAGGSGKSTCSMISHLKFAWKISYCGVNVERESHQTEQVVHKGATVMVGGKREKSKA
jgi:hypothetical protein